MEITSTNTMPEHVVALGVACASSDKDDEGAHMWAGEKAEGVRVVVQELLHGPALEAGDPRWSVCVILDYQHEAAEGMGETLEAAEGQARAQLSHLAGTLASLAR